MTEPYADDHVQTWLPDAEWYGLFTPAHLDHLAPRRGEEGDPLPCLEVHYREHGERKVAVMLLAIDGFNDWDTRKQAMQAIGRQWAKALWYVLALRFATAAWGKMLTPAEQAARGTRLVETYPDRQEIFLVQGLTLDGRTAMASAELVRDKTGRIRAVRPWDIWTPQTEPGLKAESYILKAALAGYAQAILESTQEDDDA